MTKLRITRIVLLAIALVFMGALVARLGPRTIVDQLGSAGGAALLLLVAYAIGTAIGALPWYVLLRRDDRPSVGAAVASRFAASGINVIVPLLGVAGEPVRLVWLRPSQHAAGVAALVIDRLTYALASALFLAIGALAAVQLVRLPSSYTAAAALGALLLLAITFTAIWIVARHRLADRVHRLIERIQRRTVPDDTRFGADVDRELESILARRRQVLLAIAIGLVARIALGAEIYAGFYVLDVPLSPSAALVFAAVPVLLAFVGAVIPGQLGIQEGSQALVATALGLSPTTAVAVVLLTRIRQLVSAGFGWLLLANHRARASADR